MNKVLNFSFHLRPDSQFWLPTNAHIGTVSEHLDAAQAAEYAEHQDFDILLVFAEHHVPKGVFFRRYLEELLPRHHRLAGTRAAAETRLSDIIHSLDAEGIQFHSEKVNYDMRVCPRGHVTDGDPCAVHGLPTTPYQP